MRRLILAVTILLSIHVVADFDAGRDAYMAGDYETAFNEIKASAEQGNTKAQNVVGIM